MRKTKKAWVLLAVAAMFFSVRPLVAREIAGEAFGRTITMEEFNYYLRTATLFSRSGGDRRSEDDARKEAWMNLIYRHEARELDIKVSRRKLEDELQRLLVERDVRYGSVEYERWVQQQFGESVEVFERRIEDLLIINELVRMKSEPEISVTEKDLMDKFLDVHNSFESEYIKFDSKEDAENFAENVRRKPSLWYEEYMTKKDKGQQGASWINIMSIGALVDLWKIPRSDAYRIHGAEPGDFIVAGFYYGNGVFRLLNKNDADMAKYTEQKREEYRNTLRNTKRKQKVDGYFGDLEKRADYKDYVVEERRAKNIKELQKESEVTLETNQGNIVLRLFPDVAPKTCQNFIGLVKKGYYDGIIFHRVIKNFMIQGGDPTGTGTGGESLWGGKFEDEVKEDVIFDRPGIIAMANAGPDTNGSQFFITTKPTAHLNMKHTIFGEVKEGYDVVQKIENAPTGPRDKPKEDQKIIRAYVSGS